MGCHTWFYKKLNPQPTFEEVKQSVIESLNDEIDFCHQLVDSRDTIDKDLLEAYPEWTPEYGYEHEKEYQEHLQNVLSAIELDDFMINAYSIHNLFHHLEYAEDKGWFAASGNLPHDIFRIGNYPEDRLFSLEDTARFIFKNRHKIYGYYYNEFQEKDWREQIRDFWAQNPDGMIEFG